MAVCLPALIATLWVGHSTIAKKNLQLKPFQETSLILLEGNTLISLSVPLFYTHFATYGSLIDKSEDNIGSLIKCLIQKESSGRPNAYNKDDPNGGSFGILQFQKPTWLLFNKKYKLDLDINNPEHQIYLAEKMIEENSKNAEHWSTYKLCRNK